MKHPQRLPKIIGGAVGMAATALFLLLSLSALTARAAPCPPEVVFGVEQQGLHFIFTSAAGSTPFRFTSHEDPWVARTGLCTEGAPCPIGGLFKNDGPPNRYDLDIVFCPEPGPSGFPPTACVDIQAEVQVFQESPLKWRVRNFNTLGDFDILTLQWSDGVGHQLWPICGAWD